MTRDMRPVYERIANGLREFGYPDVTSEMVKECVDAYHDGRPMPCGVVGVFIKMKLDDEREERNQR